MDRPTSACTGRRGAVLCCAVLCCAVLCCALCVWLICCVTNLPVNQSINDMLSVRVNTTLVCDFLPGHALLNVKLSGGAGIAADSFNIDYSVYTNNSAVVTIATTDSSALVGVASNTVTGMFTTASATLGTVTVNACVTGPGTLDASVSITALSQCAADNLFAGCNAVACNAAGSGRASCVATRSAHTCTCNLGFEGTECQTNLNEYVCAVCLPLSASVCLSVCVLLHCLLALAHRLCGVVWCGVVWCGAGVRLCRARTAPLVWTATTASPAPVWRATAACCVRPTSMSTFCAHAIKYSPTAVWCGVV
jgi:hypothetical protein